MKKILVTGSSGFIGSHLCRYLSDRGYDVVGLSLHPKDNFCLKEIQGDIRKLSHVPKEISHIIHLAALTDVDYCEKFPKTCFDVNVNGTQNMLEIARKIKANFIFASTSHVFGIPASLPISEKAQLHPMSVYAGSKACGELLCESYSNSYEMNISVIRSFSVYGESSPDHLVTTKIIKQMISKNKVILGNLSSKRDFIYVSDLISAYHLVIQKMKKGFSKYNVGSGSSISISELFKMLKKISGKNIIIQSKKNNRRRREIPNLVCDISEIKRLGWKPILSLEEGLSLTYNWYNNNMTRQKSI